MMTFLGHLWVAVVVGLLVLFALLALLGALAPHRVGCVRCGGMGTVEQRAHPMNRRVPCPVCDGTGWQTVRR